MTERYDVRCPVCMLHFDIDAYLDVGDATVCPNCSAHLEIISLMPPRVEEILAEDNSYYFIDSDEG